MSRGRRDKPQTVPPRVCAPALLLCVPAIAEVALASRRYWFTEAAWWGDGLVVRGLACACLAGAAALAFFPSARERLVRAGEAPVSRSWLLVAYSGVFSWLFFIKYCQYRGFQLPRDTTTIANLSYNLLHGFGWRAPVVGLESFFASHFIPFFVLFAPLLLLHNGVLTLIVAQTLLLATLPFACYRLARRLTGSGLAAWSAFALVAMSSYFFDLASASVYPGIYLSVFFLWGAAALELGESTRAAVALVLMLLTVEQACLAALGLALYWAARRRSAVPLAAAAAAVVLFALELRYKYSFPEAARLRSWTMFHQLGPTPGAALAAALASPWKAAWGLVWPPARVLPAIELLGSAGFLPLLSPLALLPWLVDFMPNFLADSSDIYHTIGIHYAGYVIGPLWWAAALGLCRLWSRPESSGRRHLAAAFVLLVCGVNLIVAPIPLQADWNRNFFSEGPPAAAAIPGDASVWALEFVSPWLACRRDVKAIPEGFDGAFLARLFMPDYVVLDRAWPERAVPADRDRLLTFLGREGYRKVFERYQLVVLRHPRAPLEGPDGAPPPLALPEAGPEKAASLTLLQRNDDPSGTLRLTLAMAEKGDDYAQFNAGVELMKGNGAPKDEEAGARWWRKAAEQGLARAQAEYGRFLYARADYAGAVTWLGAAAAQGDVDAQFNLGLVYSLGKGVPADRVLAARWFRAAAERGQATAQYNLGIVLLDVDRAEAIAWLERAAAAGHPLAAKRLAALR